MRAFWVYILGTMDKHIQKFREHNDSLLPTWYRWQLHILLNFVLFLFFLYLGIKKVDLLSLYTPLFLALSILAWGVIEYALHRFILHGNVFNFLHFKKEHTVYHHTFFEDHEMNMQSAHDLNRTLLRPLDIFSVLALNWALSIFIAAIVSEGFANYFYLGGVFYLFLYEVMHAMTHTYEGKNKFLLNIKEHHRKHHMKKEMNDINFAVVFPFLDNLFATNNLKSKGSRL